MPNLGDAEVVKSSPYEFLVVWGAQCGGGATINNDVESRGQGYGFIISADQQRIE